MWLFNILLKDNLDSFGLILYFYHVLQSENFLKYYLIMHVMIFLYMPLDYAKFPILWLTKGKDIPKKEWVYCRQLYKGRLIANYDAIKEGSWVSIFFLRVRWQKNLSIWNFQSLIRKIEKIPHHFWGIENSHLCTKFVQIFEEGERGWTVKAKKIVIISKKASN